MKSKGQQGEDKSETEEGAEDKRVKEGMNSLSTSENGREEAQGHKAAFHPNNQLGRVA